MDQSEISDIIGVIGLRYPRNDVLPPTLDTKAARDAVVKVWHDVLGDLPGEDVRAVLAHWSKTQRFAPDPSELRQRALDLDGLRPERIELLRQMVQGETIGETKRQELAALEAGAPLSPESRAEMLARRPPEYAALGQ